MFQIGEALWGWRVGVSCEAGRHRCLFSLELIPPSWYQYHLHHYHQYHLRFYLCQMIATKMMDADAEDCISMALHPNDNFPNSYISNTRLSLWMPPRARARHSRFWSDFPCLCFGKLLVLILYKFVENIIEMEKMVLLSGFLVYFDSLALAQPSKGE